MCSALQVIIINHLHIVWVYFTDVFAFSPYSLSPAKICFPLTEPYIYDQPSSSSIHLIITSLVDKYAQKSVELFDSGQIELSDMSFLKDISDI